VKKQKKVKKDEKTAKRRPPWRMYAAGRSGFPLFKFSAGHV
jgi:hypothetical protein